MSDIKTLDFGKFDPSSDMKNDDLMHREDLTLAARGSTLVVRIWRLHVDVRFWRPQTSTEVQSRSPHSKSKTISIGRNHIT